MTFGSPVLAALLTPALFAGGAAAMAAPILIHLLSRRRFKRIRWAAMDFLIDAERRNRRRIRMEDWILLALRCLGVFLIGLMLARPFVSPIGLAAALGAAQRIRLNRRRDRRWMRIGAAMAAAPPAKRAGVSKAARTGDPNVIEDSLRFPKSECQIANSHWRGSYVTLFRHWTFSILFMPLPVGASCERPGISSAPRRGCPPC